MKRRISLCLAVWGLAASFCAAGIPTDTFTISLPREKAYLSIRQGELKVDEAPHDVEWEGRPAPGRWYIEGTRIKSSVGSGYLAYDPSGKDPKVFLSPKPPKDADWAISVPERDRTDEGKRAVIRAGSGKLKGWYLAVQEVEETRPDGKTVTTNRLVLAKNPQRRLEVKRIIEHK
jgi:hypothetical protein